VDEPTYEVRVEGELSPLWSEWFDGLSMHYICDSAGAPGYTVLLLKTSDPARLHGVLAQIGNLNLNLISVVRKE
jgi:hypothetical protein